MGEKQENLPPRIVAGEFDPEFKSNMEKTHGAENIALCFQCGTCSADCPVSRFSDLYKPRKIVRMVQFGLKDKLLSDEALWLCTTCYTCVDRCPEGVEIAGIVRALRNLAVREKYTMPIVFKELAFNILKTGFVYEFPESRLKRRETQGLPPIPKPNLGQIRKIFEITGSSGTLEKAKTFERVKG
jgi:heterodisulfide reductase subunit C